MIIIKIIVNIIIMMMSTGAFSGSSIGLWEFGTMMCSQCILVMLIQVIGQDDHDDQKEEDGGHAHISDR